MISSSGLERLIVSENSMSDLWAMLAELDPAPVASVLSLASDQNYELRREVRVPKGRLDIRVDNAHGDPVAVIEMKGAATTHGDQLDRYSAWADTWSHPPELFFCSFDRDEEEVPERWEILRLRDLFAPWTDSDHPHAAWLANQVTSVLDEWDTQADGVLGNRTGHYVPDIVTKRLARDVDALLRERLEGESGCHPTRDNGGSPMIFAWAAHPKDPSDTTVSIGVDLRSPIRTSQQPWSFRPHVEVDPTENRDLVAARQEALRLAQALHPSMGLSSLRAALAERGLGNAASALSADRHEGFKRSAQDFDFDAFSQRISTARYPGGGLFGYDRGTRLASILQLDTRELTRHDICGLVVAAVEILHEGAARPSR